MAEVKDKVVTVEGLKELHDYAENVYLKNNKLVGSEVEWVNPPMEINVEYRTAERWLGKPVYTKLIDFGNLPASETKSFRVFAEDVDITNIKMINIEGIATSSATGSCQIMPIVTYSTGGAVYAQYHNTTGYISVVVRQDLSNYSVYFKCKYTKE